MSETWAVVLDRDVVEVTGPESASYLQGQLSQDVAALPAGGFAWSWLLAPNGKVDALLRVTRTSGDEWLLDTDAGWGEAVVARLMRFKLRTKVDAVLSERRVVALRGPGWDPASFTGVALTPPWPGVDGLDLITDQPDLSGVAMQPVSSYEAPRIRAGIPKMGAELDERTIPAETGLIPLTVSFTKGCYTGQELVARIDSRGGNVPRHLRRLRFDLASGATVAPGAGLIGPDGAPAGTVTSAAALPSGQWVGLGFVRRGVEIGSRLTADTGPGPTVEAVQEELPV